MTHEPPAPPAAERPASERPAGFDPARLLTGLLAGLVVGSVVVIVAISFAVLIFSGDLEPFMARGIGLALFTATVMAGLIALTSSFPGMVATPQDVPAAITALIAASVAASLPAAASSEELYATVVAAIAVTALATGVFFLALGFFKLGGLIRFIPYPVIGGFLAGTGWLLVKGSFGVLADTSLTRAGLPMLLTAEAASRWLPGLVFAVVLLLVLRRTRHFLVLPAMLLGAIALFYVMLLATRTSIAEATAAGWLLGPFPSADIWQPIGPSTLAEVNWGVLAGEARGMMAVLVVGVVALLLNASGLELVVERDINLDRELRAAGLANVVSGLGGGLVGFQTLSLSTLGHRVAAGSRMVGLVSAALCATGLVFGSAFLSYFPKPVLGGLLLFLGLAFLSEWVWDAWRKLPRIDYFVVLLILAVIAWVGFLESVGVGIVIAVVLFVVNYSRINVVKHALSGASQHSNVQRPRRHEATLRDKGDQIFILQLQGFVFFGTANNLLQRVQARIDDRELAPVRYLVLDFRLVSGIDSSAALSFVKLRQLAERHDFELVFSNTLPEIRNQLEMGQMRPEGWSAARWFPEMDRAVEWCEDRILDADGLAIEGEQLPLAEQLALIVPETADVSRLMGYLERQEVPERHYLMRQGEAADEIFFIESGQVTAQIDVDGKTVRLLTMSAGTVGEMEAYMGTARAASCVTERPSVVYRLGIDELHRMEREEPEIAAAFHRFIARLLAERVVGNHRTLAALLR